MNYFMIHLLESMGPACDRTHDPWIFSPLCISRKTHYRLRYADRCIQKQYLEQNYRYSLIITSYPLRMTEGIYSEYSDI